jgi:hypothetical protein
MGLDPASPLFLDADQDPVPVHDTAHLAAIQIDIFFSPFFGDEEAKPALMTLDFPHNEILASW